MTEEGGREGGREKGREVKKQSGDEKEQYNKSE